MAAYIEEQIRKCKKCKKKTIHQRNNTRTGGVMMLLHVVLTLLTVGTWLVLLILYKILHNPIGGWSCKECGN